MDFTHYSNCGVLAAVDLVNTAGFHTGTEALPDVDSLRRFLVDHTISGVGVVTQEDLVAVRALRAPLRAVLTAEDEAEAAAGLNELVARGGATPWLTNHDGEGWHLHYTGPDAPLVDRFSATVGMGLAVVFADEGLTRFRQCAKEDCGDVFVDSSRNRSRRYCDPTTCGNSVNVAAHRARRRAAGGQTH